MRNRSTFSLKSTSRAIFLLACVCLVGARASAQASAAPAQAAQPYAEARANADKIGNKLMARGIPGLALAVAVNGRLVYAQGFGYADLQERVPAWPTTRFRIGSISKPLTAVALMQLVKQGRVDLDAPVQRYVPSFPDKGTKITPRLLAGHLAQSATTRMTNS
jgi:serine beta-lactamase-like protein LACTB, mitochondrial